MTPIGCKIIALLFIISCSISHAQGDSQHLIDAKEALTTNPTLSIQHATIALQKAEKANNHEDLVIATKYLGTAYYYLGKIDSTVFWWEQCVVHAQKSTPKNISDAYNNLGVIYQRTGLVDSSYFCYQKSLNIRIQMNDSLGVANSNLNLGTLDRLKGNYHSALEHYYEAIAIYEDYDDIEKLAEAYNSLGLIYLGIKEYENALEFLEKSLEIKSSIGNQKKIGRSLNNIAAAHNQSGNFDLAEKYYLEAFDIFKNTTDKRMIAGITSNLGIIYKEREEFDKATRFYLRAASEFDELQDHEGKASVYSNLGSIYYLKEEYAKAKTAFETAYTSSQLIHSLPIQIKITKGLSRVNSRLGNYETANLMLDEYQELNDSVFSIELAQSTAEMREKYETEKREKEIIQLENDALAFKAAQKRRQLYWWITVTSTLIAILVLIFIINRNRLKRRILVIETERLKLRNELKEVEINTKDRKITSLATNTMEKDKLIKAVLSELDGVSFDSNSTTIKTEQIKRQLKNVINVDDAWNKFKQHFEDVHPNFFSELKEKFPKLTQNDLRHCAYIKMNLNSKEIGMFLNIMPKSVKMNRYRLKKKLGLSDEQDVYKFIQRIS